VELVDLYHAPLLRFARTFIRQPSQAEDVVQDAWVGVLRGLERFERRSSFKTWAVRLHLLMCVGCSRYYRQMRTTLTILRQFGRDTTGTSADRARDLFRAHRNS